MPAKQPCEDCGELTDLRGWVFVMRKRKAEPDEDIMSRFLKRYQWWCEKHYPTHMFNLYPYQCTEECLEARSKKIGIVLRPEDGIVWLRLSCLLQAEGRLVRPKCPWCCKAMQPMEK